MSQAAVQHKMTASPIESSPTISPSSDRSSSEASEQPTSSPTPLAAQPQILGFFGNSLLTFPNGLIGIQAVVDTEELPPLSCQFFNPDPNMQIVFSVVQDVPPFAYPSSTPPLILSSSQFPFEFDPVSGNITGSVPSNMSDLAAYPLTCFTFPLNLRNLSVEHMSTHYDSVTGQVRIESPQFNLSSVATNICPIFWLGVNLVAGQAFDTGPIANAFHVVRNSGNPYMTFPNSPDYAGYFANLIVNAIPFWAITLLCLFLYPSVLCVRLYLKFKHRATCGLIPKFCCCCCRNRFADKEDKEPLIKLSRAEEYRQEIHAILAPQPFRQRICILIVGMFAAACVLIIIIATAYTNNAEAFLNELDTSVMLHSNDQAVLLLAQLQETFLAASGNETYLAELNISIYNTMLPVAEYCILSNPSNLRPITLVGTFFYPSWTIVIEIVVLTCLTLVPILIIWAAILSSCTFRYQERVKCEGVSRWIGGSLRCYMITCATLCWAVVMFSFYTVSLNSDVCFFPSILYMPLTNSSQLGMTVQPFFDPNAMAFFYPQSDEYKFYDAESNNYLFNGVNVAEFYYDCDYIKNIDGAIVGNPFAAAMSTAYAANQLALNLAQANQDQTTMRRLQLAGLNMRNLAPQLSCSDFGTIIHQLMDSICFTGVTAGFIVFLFLMILGTTLMIFIPCANWVHPNMYRQMLANKVFDRVQRERVNRIKQTASKNQKFASESQTDAPDGAGARRDGEDDEDDNKSTSFLRRASMVFSSARYDNKHRQHRKESLGGGEDEDEDEGERARADSSGKGMDYTFNADVSHV
ncbi:hypothetical protein BASA81_012910 [Batrachochytrium salamandrivorans]|nr:hypothetical protein BASA81_012910 [Batrachochytrium salamandrivorans]